MKQQGTQRWRHRLAGEAVRPAETARSDARSCPDSRSPAGRSMPQDMSQFLQVFFEETEEHLATLELP